MNKISQLPPLSLYIHLPWCVKKCPYCDFNSHKLNNKLPEKEYITCLIQDFKQYIEIINRREIHSIFFGGGTPSLFSAESIENLLTELSKLAKFSPNCEITLEANPGTVEQQRFHGFRQAGINRISLGVQSFQADKLKLLGRIHNNIEAHNAIEAIHKAGFDNFNIDIMHGLPEQNVADALYDLDQAIKHAPTHISWYQLTIEPNTYFYKHTPVLPNEQVLHQIEQQGLDLLRKYHYQRYEISAYAKNNLNKDLRSQHNLNYWLFGDYLGIGAGAHSKLSQIITPGQLDITRHWNYRSPYSYMNSKNKFCSKQTLLTQQEKIFEFMLNALRLFQSIELGLFEKHTGLSRDFLIKKIKTAVNKKLLTFQQNSTESFIETTSLGKKFLDDLCQLFLI